MRKFVLSPLFILLMLPAYSQKSKVKVHSISDDSAACGILISSYRTFFKNKIYEDAYSTWIIAFNNCRDSSEMMYVDGATMYRSFIETATDELVREERIDTLMLIYDLRMEYFGGEGNILGRKGKDLLTYRRTDIEQVEKAYSMLRESIELEGKESRETVLLSFISAGVQLYSEEKFDNNQLIEDYSLAIGILDQLEGSSFRVERVRTTIERVIREKDILSCDALDNYFSPQLEDNVNNPAFFEWVISIYESAGCDHSDLYVTALENLYRTESGPESAHDLAFLFIASDDLQKAADYLKIAVQGEQIDSETRAEWYYELAVVSYANKSFCEAIDFAREAIELKKDFGKAYILLGDVFIASREELGDEVHRRAAFWAAADMYAKADSVDPSIEAEVKQKLIETATQYPSQEDIFFLDLKDGDPYHVEGCINTNTTVRSRE
ncbi:MAG: hypothetical protein U9R60_06270 [Bacteroidota bacterium]|nr:hypothetical protein [Bacteroidota bacterium]